MDSFVLCCCCCCCCRSHRLSKMMTMLPMVEMAGIGAAVWCRWPGVKFRAFFVHSKQQQQQQTTEQHMYVCSNINKHIASIFNTSATLISSNPNVYVCACVCQVDGVVLLKEHFGLTIKWIMITASKAIIITIQQATNQPTDNVHNEVK